MRPLELAGVGGKVVDQNEIEVGRCGHFARAEFAEPNYRNPAAVHLAMLRGECFCDPRKQRGDQPLRQDAVGASGPIGVQAPREQIEADMKHLLSGEITGAIERFLVARRLSDKGFDPRAHPVVVKARLKIGAA